MVGEKIRNYRAEIAFDFNAYIDVCPMCHMKIEPIVLFVPEPINNFKDNRMVRYVIFNCPNEECREVFVAKFSRPGNSKDNYYFQWLRPYNFKTEDFEKPINDISPTFVDVYNQSWRAEQSGFNEICGMGYRKALEFLIKDYLCTVLPEEEVAKIPTMDISRCIKDYITDPRIKSNAERAVWLGNDETHFVRLHEEYNVDDMKKLIKLVVLYITMEITSGEYEEKIQHKKKQ